MGEEGKQEGCWWGRLGPTLHNLRSVLPPFWRRGGALRVLSQALKYIFPPHSPSLPLPPAVLLFAGPGYLACARVASLLLLAIAVAAVAVVVWLWVGLHTHPRSPMSAEDKKKVAHILRSAGVRASLGVY